MNAAVTFFGAAAGAVLVRISTTIVTGYGRKTFREQAVMLRQSYKDVELRRARLVEEILPLVPLSGHNDERDGDPHGLKWMERLLQR